MWSVFCVLLLVSVAFSDQHRSTRSSLYRHRIRSPRDQKTQDLQHQKPEGVSLGVEDIGTFKNETVKKFTWTTSSGVSVSVISYGAIIQSVKLPDQQGQESDVVLGFDDLESYVTRNVPYFGATVGRVANRIGGASFELDGATYYLAKNAGNNTLHGGLVGFDKVNWNHIVQGNKVIFSYFSKDLEEGFPGNLVTSVAYEVTDEGVLVVQYQATTDKRTVINLTNHAYFNLAGQGTGPEELVNHIVAINANKITETDADSIPTGKLLDVGGTPYDLRIARRLGDALSSVPSGFDDNYVVTANGNKSVSFVSRVSHPSSGRYLEVYSNAPGVQFYTANNLPSPGDAPLVGKDGVRYKKQGAFCLETQGFPDAIHHQNFPSVVLSPGEVYDHKVLYKFGVQKSSFV